MNDNSYSVKTFITNDMSFSAYLILKGVEMIGAKKLGSSFKFEFDNDPRIKQLQIGYINSEISKHDDVVRKLKKIVFGDGDKREAAFNNLRKVGNR